MADDLVARLRAALDETERIALAVADEQWAEDVAAAEGWNEYHEAVRMHIVRHGPASVLRMVAAHRKILDEVVKADAESQKDPYEKAMVGYWEGLSTAVEALAEGYGIEP